MQVNDINKGKFVSVEFKKPLVGRVWSISVLEKVYYDTETSSYKYSDDKGKYEVTLLIAKNSESEKILKNSIQEIQNYMKAKYKERVFFNRAMSSIRDGDIEDNFNQYYDEFKNHWVVTFKSKNPITLYTMLRKKLNIKEVSKDDEIYKSNFYRGVVVALIGQLYIAEGVKTINCLVNGIKTVKHSKPFEEFREVSIDELEAFEESELDFFDDYSFDENEVDYDDDEEIPY